MAFRPIRSSRIRPSMPTPPEKNVGSFTRISRSLRKGRSRDAQNDTVDYRVVYDGEISLELDDGETLHLRRGDVVVQNGTRHAWRNKGAKPVTMLFFLNGARA